MSMQRPLEGLLRPPLEWYSALAGLTAAGGLVVSTSTFLMPASLAYASAATLSLFALVRFKQGHRIYRYTRNLKRMPSYSMGAKELPVSKTHLFLGRGFAWKTIHTQRLRDLDLDYNAKYRESFANKAARDLEHRLQAKPALQWLVNKLQSSSVFNPLRPYPAIGGQPVLHGVGEKEKDIMLNMHDRAGHTIVIGTTGVGKTRLAELLIGQDIRRGDVVVVLDPKGDADLLKRMYIEAMLAGRENDLIILHLGFPELSARYNAIGNFTKITQVATRITNALPATGNAAAFKDFAWKFANLVTRTLVAMSIKPTYKLMNFYITKLDQLLIRYCDEYVSKSEATYETWIKDYIQANTRLNKDGSLMSPSREKAIHAFVEHQIETRNKGDIQQLGNDVLTDLYAACQLDRTYYDKITASIGPLLEKLTTGQVVDLLSPDYSDKNDQRPILDWLQVIRNKQIVYVGMDALTDAVVSSTVGNAMLSDLVSVAGHLYNYGIGKGFEGLSQMPLVLPKLYLHADEFNEIIGDEVIQILNKARGAGFNVTAYTQTWADVEARLASAAKAEQTAGNLNNLIMLRTQSARTVDMLLSLLPKIPIFTVTPASSSADTAHGEGGIYYSSSNEDRLSYKDMPLLQPSDILNLPKGQAFCRLEGGNLYKLRIPLPKQEAINIPKNVEALVIEMRKRQETH
jgi:conjugative coupling factor TraD (TOL family)